MPDTTEPQATELHPTELVSFDDPTEHRTWVFDVTFLTGSWSCIFGRGCPGVLTEPAPELEQGCCSYGAHLVDEDDATAVLAAAERLTDAQWHNRRVAQRRGGPLRRTPSGGQATRLVDDVCIFHNPSGFAGGTGCALHLAALDAGERPLDWKPDVCWQVPLRRVDLVEDDGHVVSTLRRWLRRDWGDGGQEFHWWCTEDPGADDGHEPVYRALRDEIVELVGTWAYDRFVRFVEDRGGPHPPGRPVNIAPGTRHRVVAQP
jgi:hypothetical protein